MKYNWFCPGCDHENWIVVPEVGDVVECDSCGEENEIKEIEDSIGQVFVT